jgi:hypothetical protein
MAANSTREETTMNATKTKLTERPAAGTTVEYKANDGRWYKATVASTDQDSRGGEWIGLHLVGSAVTVITWALLNDIRLPA